MTLLMTMRSSLWQSAILYSYWTRWVQARVQGGNSRSTSPSTHDLYCSCTIHLCMPLYLKRPYGNRMCFRGQPCAPSQEGGPQSSPFYDPPTNVPNVWRRTTKFGITRAEGACFDGAGQFSAGPNNKHDPISEKE